MKSGHTAEDWLRLDSEVNEAIQRSTATEIQEFVDSGAGETLDMACSAIREIRKRQ